MLNGPRPLNDAFQDYHPGLRPNQPPPQKASVVFRFRITIVVGERIYARASALLTVIVCQRPPRAVETPPALSASAISRSVVTPAARILGSAELNRTNLKNPGVTRLMVELTEC
jgi:hypothetical protein